MKFTLTWLSRHFKLRSRPINCDMLLHKIVHMYVVFALFRYLLSLQHRTQKILLLYFINILRNPYLTCLTLSVRGQSKDQNRTERIE